MIAYSTYNQATYAEPKHCLTRAAIIYITSCIAERDSRLAH